MIEHQIFRVWSSLAHDRLFSSDCCRRSYFVAVAPELGMEHLGRNRRFWRPRLFPVLTPMMTATPHDVEDVHTFDPSGATSFSSSCRVDRGHELVEALHQMPAHPPESGAVDVARLVMKPPERPRLSGNHVFGVTDEFDVMSFTLSCVSVSPCHPVLLVRAIRLVAHSLVVGADPGIGGFPRTHDGRMSRLMTLALGPRVSHCAMNRSRTSRSPSQGCWSDRLTGGGVLPGRGSPCPIMSSFSGTCIEAISS